MWSILAFQHIVVYHFVVFVLGFDISGGSKSSVRHQNRAKKETKPSHTSALSSNKFFFLCVFSRIYVVNFHIKWSISHISSILCDCVSLSATFAHSLKMFDVPCVCMVLFLSGSSSPQENFSSSFFDFNTDRRTDKTMLYIFTFVLFGLTWSSIRSPNIHIVSSTRKKKRNWGRFMRQNVTMITKHMQIELVESEWKKSQIQLWIWFEMRVFGIHTRREKKKYIDNYINDNGKSSNVSRICARIDKTLIRCHVFNIDQMKIQIVSSMVCVCVFSPILWIHIRLFLGWNWIFGCDLREMGVRLWITYGILTCKARDNAVNVWFIFTEYFV